MPKSTTRLAALSVFAVLCFGAAETKAQDLDTAAFIVSCTKDPVVTEDPGFDEAKVTPQTFCECVAGKLTAAKVPQTDVDMLVKMHNEDITDADAEAFPNLDELLVANEGHEDACRQSLGVAIEDLDNGEFPTEEEIPEEGMTDEDMPDEGE
jgi:hypothetical protein